MPSGPPYKTFGVIEVFCGEYDAKGLRFLKEDKFQEALQYCEESLKKCPDSAYYARQKGLALLGLGREKDALECFDSVLEKFHRYTTINALTSIDLFEITFRTMWQFTSILKLSGRQEEFERVFSQFFKSLAVLEEYSISKNNREYGKSLVLPQVGEYAAYVCAIRGDNEGAIRHVQSIVDYWQGYINYFGEPCNVDKVEMFNRLKDRFNREPAFEGLRSDERLWRVLESLRNKELRKNATPDKRN